MRAQAFVALALIGLTVALLVPRMISGISQLSSTADAQAVRISQTNGTTPPDLLAADSIDIDNDFAEAAVRTLPSDARYGILLPADVEGAQETYGILPLTIEGMPAFLRNLLLPRREVDPEHHVTPHVPVGAFVLCYYCDTSMWDARTHWLWNSHHGTAIGRVYG